MALHNLPSDFFSYLTPIVEKLSRDEEGSLSNETPSELSFEYERSDEAAHSDYLCIICHRLAYEPRSVPECGHRTFCEACLKAWFRVERSCPCCKKTGLSGLVAKLCPERVALMDGLMVRCTSSGCIVERRLFKEHLKSCPRPCMRCGLVVPLASRKTHYERDCPAAIVKCPRSALGICVWRGKRQDYVSHIKDCKKDVLLDSALYQCLQSKQESGRKIDQLRHRISVLESKSRKDHLTLATISNKVADLEQALAQQGKRTGRQAEDKDVLCGQSSSPCSCSDGLCSSLCKDSSCSGRASRHREMRDSPWNSDQKERSKRRRTGLGLFGSDSEED